MKPWLLEVNSFPSMFPNPTGLSSNSISHDSTYSLCSDLKVKRLMVAEMFNILGFHSSLKDEDLEKFYGRAKDREQEWKEEKFYNNIKEDTDLLLNLTERDCRTIMKLKEELYQAQSFKPLLPDHKRKRCRLYSI